MYAVETYAAVRQFVFVEGKSRREAARVFGLHRDTISKICRFSAPPGYVRNKPPGKPKLGPLIPVIDAILAADVTAPPKQRHTAKRIFERLQAEHGFTGGYTVVKDYVRSAKLRAKETFVPLAHPPGHAQVDFGEAIAVIGGVRQKIHVFFMDVPHSDASFMKAYPAETFCERLPLTINVRFWRLFLTVMSAPSPFSAVCRYRSSTTTPSWLWPGSAAMASGSGRGPSVN
jgi:transposase